MKRVLSKSQNILIRAIWLCVIGCCVLIVNIKIHAAEKIDLNVEREVESSDIHYVLADDREANDPSTAENEKKTVEDQPWEPPPPPPDEFDWIQLTSGEWLKGEFKALYERKLEFDSDELGLQKFDWEDVKHVRGHQIFSVRFEGPITVVGLLEVTEDKVFVTVGEEKQEFERDQLIAIVSGEPKEIKRWSAKIDVGVNISRGNTKQTQGSAMANIKRRTSATRFVTDYLGNFTETEDVETINNHRVESYFDYFVSRKIFLRPIFGEYYRDPFKNIKYRATVGTGVGYHIIDTPKTQWDVAAGPAYQKTQFDDVQPGEDSSEDTPAFVAGTHFETELTRTVDFDGRYNFQFVNEESGTYSHHMVLAFETELTGWLDFDISFVWDRTQDPTRLADGTEPKKDDFFYIISLGVEF
ncbi:MAG: DUF481 domain-containing protein [Proteobacteria bacterium]|nr:DUF481 domain-containing protein [Pseudomonadota bacterium]